jgi:2-phosphoglycerate kinase
MATDDGRCVILLFGGTSGSGKSTLASLMASRLGITTVWIRPLLMTADDH